MRSPTHRALYRCNPKAVNVELLSQVVGACLSATSRDFLRLGKEHLVRAEEDGLVALLIEQKAKLHDALGELADLIDPTILKADQNGMGTAKLEKLVNTEADVAESNQTRSALVFAATSIDLG